LLRCFDKDVSSRATAKELLEHDWIKRHRKDNTNRDPTAVRTTLRNYNEQPTIVPGVEGEIENESKAEEEEIKAEIAQVAKEVLPDLSAEEAVRYLHIILIFKKRANIIQVIEKLQAKLDLVSRRVAKRLFQENSLVMLSKLYGKYLKEEKEKFERQTRYVHDCLEVDRKLQEELLWNIRKMKQSVSFIISISLLALDL
jgi:hypothetical protein